MKSYIIKLFRRCGINVSLYRPSNSDAAQLKHVLDMTKTNLIFDIGANDGYFANETITHGYLGKIVSFEPQRCSLDYLKIIAKNNPNWIIHQQTAVGNFNGFVDLNISKNSVSSSILPILKLHLDAASESKYVNIETVPVCTIDSIAKRYINSNTNLFMKIDTQGYEFQVLEGAKETLNSTVGIICELSIVPLYSGQRLWIEIIDHLKSCGFVLWGLQKGFTDPRTGQTLQFDGIFIRE